MRLFKNLLRPSKYSRVYSILLRKMIEKKKNGIQTIILGIIENNCYHWSTSPIAIIISFRLQFSTEKYNIISFSVELLMYVAQKPNQRLRHLHRGPCPGPTHHRNKYLLGSEWWYFLFLKILIRGQVCPYSHVWERIHYWEEIISGI